MELDFPTVEPNILRLSIFFGDQLYGRQLTIEQRHGQCRRRYQ
jgi:hypothetical protein